MPHPKIPRVVRGSDNKVTDTPEARSSAICFMEQMGERIRREGFNCALNTAKADLRKPKTTREKRLYMKKIIARGGRPK